MTADTIGLQSISDIVSDIAAELNRILNSAFQSLRDFIQGLINGIQERIGNLAYSIWEIAQSIISKVRDVVSSLTAEISDILHTLVESFKQAIQDLISEIRHVVEGIVDGLKRLIADMREGIESLIEGLKDGISWLVASIKQFADNLITTIRNKIDALVKQGWEFLLHMSETMIATARDIIHNLWSALQELWERVRSAVQPILERIDAQYIQPIRNFFKRIEEIGEETLTFLNKTTIEPILDNPDVPPQVRSLLSSNSYIRQIAVIGFSLVGMSFLLPTILSDVYFGDLEKVRQGSLQRTRAGIVNLSQAIEAYYAGTLDLGSVYYFAARQGIPDAATSALVNAYRRYPSAGDMFYLVRLGVLDYGTAADRLHKQGYRDEDIAIMYEATQYIPPVQDLIRMAVREVFTPEIAEKYGLFEDFPEDFKRQAARLGMSEEWARNYWAAHWELPSVTEGFEMLHRGIITYEELETLLRSLDYMPFWRDKLIKMSYEPYTRVDVRRMYEMGVLTRDEVKRAYLDLGYDDEKAEKLTVWTEKEYSQAAKYKTQTTRDLSQATLLSAYSKGILSRDDTIKYLVGLGYDTSEANLLVDMKDLDVYTKERDALIERLTKQYQAGAIDRLGIRDALAKFGMNSPSIEAYEDKIVSDTIVGTRIPSVSDLQKMLKKKLIALDEFIDAVMKNGYSRQWAERFAQIT